MNTYLITGGEGFIGGTLRSMIDAEAFDIKSGHNILDTEKLSEALLNKRGVFHCAAKISVPESIEKPEEYYRTNVEGSRSLIKAAEPLKQKIIFSSSAAVYGESPVAVDENAALAPLSPYAENKKEVEELLSKYSIPSVALRYFNVYGPGQSSAYAGVITIFIMNALLGEDLVIYGDGKQVRDFVFVDDVVDANIRAMELDNETFEIFTIGSGTETSVLDLAHMIRTLTNSSSSIVHAPARSGEIVYSCATISKAKTILGWSPKTSLEAGLQKTIEYYKNVGK